MSRIVRVLLFVAAAVAALILAAAVALFTLLDTKSVEAAFSRLTHDAFGTEAKLAGRVSLARFPALVVTIPPTTFVDSTTQEEKARIASAQLRISLWSLPLGAVNIAAADVTGLTTKLHLAAPTTEALAQALTQAVSFPDNVRIKNITFHDTALDVTAGADATFRRWSLSGIELKLDTLSPEMTTGFDVTGTFATGTDAATAADPEVPAEAPAPAAVDGTEPTEATEPAPTAAEAAPASAAESISETPTAPAESSVPPVSWSTFFITETHAAENLPPESAPAEEPAVSDFAKELTLLTQGAEGSFSATGKVSLSASDKTVAFEKLKFSADLTKAGHHYSVVSAADALTVTTGNVTGTNVNVSLSEPETASGDINLGAVDFRLIGNRLQSPEMRLATSDTDGDKVTSYEASASVDADLTARRAQLENLTARITVTGDKSLPQDFMAQASGFMNLDFAADKAQVGLSGTFADAPLSFNGTVSNLKAPKAVGELMISAVDFNAVPHFKSLAWMKAADFAGDLRIGQVKSGPFTASQVHSRMAVTDGVVTLKDVIVNVADGRLLGEAHMTNDAAWTMSGHLDGINLEKLFTSFAGTPVLSGVASGNFTAEGSGLDPAAVKADGNVRLLRGAYKGLNARAVRDFVAGRGKEATITQAGAWTEIDEAAGKLTLADQTLTVSDFVSRSVYQRTNADFMVALTAGTIEGTSQTTFAPSGGIPAVRLTGKFTGKAAAPVWTFDYDDARKNLLRAQGRPMVKERPREDKRSMWQSVKDFFRF